MNRNQERKIITENVVSSFLKYTRGKKLKYCTKALASIDNDLVYVLQSPGNMRGLQSANQTKPSNTSLPVSATVPFQLYTT